MADLTITLRIDPETLDAFKSTIATAHPRHIDGRGYGMSKTIKRLLLAYIATPDILRK